VSFEEDATWSLFDLVKMKAELGRSSAEMWISWKRILFANPFRRHAIMRGREVIYATG